MRKSEINSNSIFLFEKSEYQDVERELYIAPVDIYDDEDIGGTIKQTGESSFEISLSKDEVAEDNEKKESKHPILDKVHGFLDVVGFIPALGAVPDVANGIIYLCQGDYVNMSMSFIAAIPGYGDAIAGVAKGAKYAAKGAKYVKTSKLARIESNHVTEQAMFIIKMAKGQQTKSVSLLWTNGTKMNAHKVVEKVQSLAPDLKIKMLETTSRGVNMEAKVNMELRKFARNKAGMSEHEIAKALKDNTLWSKLDNHANKEIQKRFRKKLKPELEKIQRETSVEYAKELPSDVIIEFYDKSMGQLKNSQRSLLPGQANKAEINLLRKLRKGQGKRSVDGIIGVDPIK